MAVSSTKNHKGKTYRCEDCNFIFTVYRECKRLYCPSCGEYQEVVPHIGRRTEERVKVRIEWTDSELQLMNLCLKGKHSPAEVAAMLGRSYTSVHSKLQRMRERAKTKGMATK